MSISGAETISATFTYAFGRPIAAAAAWELSRLVLATPAISKLSGSARSAGTWPRDAHLKALFSHNVRFSIGLVSALLVSITTHCGQCRLMVDTVEKVPFD